MKRKRHYRERQKGNTLPRPAAFRDNRDLRRRYLRRFADRARAHERNDIAEIGG